MLRLMTYSIYRKCETKVLNSFKSKIQGIRKFTLCSLGKLWECLSNLNDIVQPKEKIYTYNLYNVTFLCAAL